MTDATIKKQSMASGWIARIGRWLAWCELVIDIRRERRQLMAMDARQLADIGVSQSEAQAESARDWFDIPTNRLRARSAHSRTPSRQKPTVLRQVFSRGR